MVAVGYSRPHFFFIGSEDDMIDRYDDALTSVAHAAIAQWNSRKPDTDVLTSPCVWIDAALIGARIE